MLGSGEKKKKIPNDSNDANPVSNNHWKLHFYLLLRTAYLSSQFMKGV